MRRLSLGPPALVAALVGALVAANASTAAPKKGPSPYAEQIVELQKVKLLLEQADHDYKGHRAAAVKHITAAIHALAMGHKHPGVKGVKGGGEPQRLSDVQLAASVKALNGVLAQVATTSGEPAVKGATHINNAIKELRIALTIK